MGVVVHSNTLSIKKNRIPAELQQFREIRIFLKRFEVFFLDQEVFENEQDAQDVEQDVQILVLSGHKLENRIQVRQAFWIMMKYLYMEQKRNVHSAEEGSKEGCIVQKTAQCFQRM